jgi:ABC-type oligopeptide transport system ATPase subunit
VDVLRLRRYFQQFGSEQVNYATVAEEFSVTKRQAEKILAELRKLEMISQCEFQHDKKMVSYQTTIKGNALGMAKAGKSVTRASADEVLRECEACHPAKPLLLPQDRPSNRRSLRDSARRSRRSGHLTHPCRSHRPRALRSRPARFSQGLLD